MNLYPYEKKMGGGGTEIVSHPEWRGGHKFWGSF